MVKKLLCAIVIFLLPTAVARLLINLYGNSISKNVRIGYSIIWADYIGLEEGVKIGHGNVLVVNRLLMRSASYFGRQNILKGPFDVHMKRMAAIGNRNLITRGRRGVSSGYSRLFLGVMAKITADHRLDCTKSIFIGDYSILAGAGSQLWTHGYIHDASGPGRYRIDGSIVIENNVYVGASCVISMGVRIGKAIIVGAGTTISKNIVEPGLYVSAAVRCIPRPVDPMSRRDLMPLPAGQVNEVVFVKKSL